MVAKIPDINGDDARRERLDAQLTLLEHEWSEFLPMLLQVYGAIEEERLVRLDRLR